MTLPQQIPKPKLSAVTVMDDDVGHHLTDDWRVPLEVSPDGRLRQGNVGHVGLIRFGGHLPKGEYDVDHGGHEGQAGAAELHG